METSIKPKMGVGEKELKPLQSQKKRLFYSWRNIVCDGDGDWIRNFHHGKLHVSLTSGLPGFHPALTSYNETLNIRVSGCQL